MASEAWWTNDGVSGDADMELPVMETWWKPDASTLKWEAWAKEKKKTDRRKNRGRRSGKRSRKRKR